MSCDGLWVLDGTYSSPPCCCWCCRCSPCCHPFGSLSCVRMCDSMLLMIVSLLVIVCRNC